MKQTAQKKSKVFRTLIRRTHIGDKLAQSADKGPVNERKNERQQERSPFFFGK